MSDVTTTSSNSSSSSKKGRKTQAPVVEAPVVEAPVVAAPAENAPPTPWDCKAFVEEVKAQWEAKGVQVDVNEVNPNEGGAYYSVRPRPTRGLGDNEKFSMLVTAALTVAKRHGKGYIQVKLSQQVPVELVDKEGRPVTVYRSFNGERGRQPFRSYYESAPGLKIFKEKILLEEERVASEAEKRLLAALGRAKEAEGKLAALEARLAALESGAKTTTTTTKAAPKREHTYSPEEEGTEVPF